MFRRDFLKLAGVAPLTMIAPGLLAAPVNQPGQWDRILVLIELKGGNDGINTVVPYRNEKYYRLRPGLALERGKALQLTEQLGFHSSMQGLLESWQSKDLAIALGVGYPNPNRSHFRSIEIWETGSESDEYLTEGWLARLFARANPPQELVADAVVLGNNELGPVSGPGMRSLTMDDPRQFIRQARRVDKPRRQGGNAALDHILGVQRNLHESVRALEARITQAPEIKTSFPTNRFGRALQTAARIITADIPLAVIKVSHGGFDTHSNQAGQHQRLLKEFADGVAAFRRAMLETGRWQNVLVMTYSEFGRRVKENGSRGTDHGTAAPHFLLGGQIKGGLYGEQPSLDRLEGGDLIHTLDYRSLYATAARRWWGLDAQLLGSDHRPLDCLG